MRGAGFAFVLGLGMCSAAAPALAGPSLSEAWFVRSDDATAQAMLADRAFCVEQASQFGVDRASDFSNPEYGSLTALGAALDEDALHGGAKQAVRRAVRDACMKKRGWTRLDPSDADAKLLKKASARNPDALEAWLKANRPAPPPPAPAPAPVAIPASSTPPAPVVDAGKLQEVKTEPTAQPSVDAGKLQEVAPPTAADAGRLQEVKTPPAETPAPHA